MIQNIVSIGLNQAEAEALRANLQPEYALLEADAWELTTSSGIAAVLLDAGSSAGSGALRGIRGDARCRSLPVFAVADAAGQREAILGGANACLMRPLDAELTAQLIRNAVCLRGASEDGGTCSPERLEYTAAEQMQDVMANVDCGITAAVREVNGETAKLLFANERFYELLGYTREQYDAEVTGSVSRIHPEDRDMVVREIKRAARTGEKKTLEYRAVRRDGRMIWIRASISHTQYSNTERLIEVGAYTDITEEKDADMQLCFLNTIAGRLLAQPDVEAAISTTLEHMMRFFGGKRAYLFEFDEERRTAANTYEACAAGVTAEKEQLQNVPMETFAVWLNTFNAKKCVYIADVDALTGDRTGEREVLQAQNIKSLVAAPMMRDGRLLGFIGIDDSPMNLTQAGRIAAIGDYMSFMLTRRDLNLQLKRETQSVTAIMNGIPGGFVRMQVMPDKKIVPLYLSEGFLRLVDMSAEEAHALYGINVTEGIHPDDLTVVRGGFKRLLAHGEVQNLRYRMRHGKRGYIWVMAFCKVHRSDTGETFVNVYYADGTEQKREEDLQISLLDHLPCGAALYDYDGKKLTAIHLNRYYWEMVRRKPMEVSEVQPMNAVYPGDRAVIGQELKAAIRQKRNCACNIRILCGGRGYRPFHIEGHLSSKKNGHYTLYAAYTPISAEIMSVQEMLPIALSAMMDTSTDFTYVKDKNLHYVCISNSAAQFVGLSSAQEVVGQTDYDLFDRERADRYTAVDRGIMKSGEPAIDCEDAEMGADGTVRYSCYSKYPLRDAAGNIIGIYGSSRDVSALRKANFELDALLNVIPSGLFKYAADEGEQFAYISMNFIKNLGYTKEQFQKKFHNSFHEMVWKEDRERAEAEILVKEADGKIGTLEYRIEAADGSLIWFRDEGICVTGQDGKQWYYVVVQDISEIKESVRKTEELAAENNRIFDNSPAWMFSCRNDDGWTLLETNRRVEEYTGYTERELWDLFGGRTETVIMPEDVFKVRNYVSRASVNPVESLITEVVLRKKNGSMNHVGMSLSVIKNVQGDDTIFVTCLDYNPLHHANAAMLRSKNKLELLYNSVPGGVFLCDASLGWQLLEANDGFFKTMGCSRREVEEKYGNSLTRMILPEYLPTLMRTTKEQLEHGTKVKSQAPIKVGGETRWVEFDCQYITAPDGRNMFYCVSLDITDKIRTQQTLTKETERIRSLYTSLPCGLSLCRFRSDGGFEFTYLNSAGYELYGIAEDLTLEEINALDFVRSKAFLQEMKSILSAPMRTGAARKTYKIHQVSGNPRWITCDVSVIEPRGEDTVYQVVFLDVTRDHQAEEAKQ
jgi:PAS domain S-box-containing protein